MQLEAALCKYFGHDSFRGQQKEVCSTILDGKDVLAVFPTGAGKSLCYQLPAVLLPGVTIVLSPLISLMQDQVMQLQKTGISATYLSSSLTKQQYHERLELLRHGTYKLVYCAPEQLDNARLRSVLKKVMVSRVVIDEAHCISEWGHDFRPAYRKITHGLQSLANYKVPCAAFTGTATLTTQKDIIDVLQLHAPDTFTQSLYRENLHLFVLPVISVAAKEVVLLSLLRKHEKTPTIIYCSTRAQTEHCTSLIQYAFGSHYSVAAYHAGMKTEERTAVQQLFLHNKLTCIAATSAFGMGVDKSDIGCVIHTQVPGSLEQYVQEVGRAGRSGKTAYCYLLDLPSDCTIQTAMMSDSRKKVRESQLQSMLLYMKNKNCRHAQLSSYFSEVLPPCAQHCDDCLGGHFSELKRSNILCESQQKKLREVIIIREKMAQTLTTDPKYLLTQQQVWWYSLLSGSASHRIEKVPGVGVGWLSRYKSLFLEIHDKISFI